MESGEKVGDHKELEFSCAQNRNKENGIDLPLGVNRVRITDKTEPLDPNFVLSLSRRNRSTSSIIERTLPMKIVRKYSVALRINLQYLNFCGCDSML